jgi:hypothetical protein
MAVAVAGSYPLVLVLTPEDRTLRPTLVELLRGRGLERAMLPHLARTMLCFMAAAVVLELLRHHQQVAASGAAAVAVVVTLLLHREHLHTVAMVALAAQQVRQERNPAAVVVVELQHQVLVALDV